MSIPVITISRQRGSGADAIAALVARKLGVPLYDRQVLARAAAEAGVSQEAVLDAERRQGFLSRMLEALGRYGTLATDVPAPVMPDTIAGSLVATSADLRVVIEQIVQRIADAGPGVIIGHGAGQVALRGRCDALHIFIHAPFEQRVQRMMAYGHLSRDEAEKDVEEMDRGRSEYFKETYDVNWYDLRLYDLVVNSGGRRYEDVADEICAVARALADRSTIETPDPRMVHA
jgi:cytidylate kinase